MQPIQEKPSSSDVLTFASCSSWEDHRRDSLPEPMQSRSSNAVEERIARFSFLRPVDLQQRMRSAFGPVQLQYHLVRTPVQKFIDLKEATTAAQAAKESRIVVIVYRGPLSDVFWGPLVSLKA
jgi:hypothetical protein